MATNDDDGTSCKDYGCEWTSDLGVPHSHLGVQPYLRRVMFHGKLIDGKTGREIGEKREAKATK